MKLRTTIWLLVWCLVLGFCVRLTWQRELLAPRDIPSRALLDIPVRNVIGLTIHGTNLVVECRRASVGAEWRLRQPINDRADQDQIDRMLGLLEAAEVRERISPEQRHARALAFGDYGLSQPAFRVVANDGARVRIVLVGHESPLGDQVYIRIAGEADVLAVPKTLLALLPRDAGALRDRAVFAGQASSAMRVEIERPSRGFVQLVRASDRWVLQQPLVSRADPVRVDLWLDAAFALKAESFVWDPPGQAPTAADAATAASGRMELYGMGAGEAVRLTIWGLRQDSRQEVLLGKTATDNADRVYAKRGDAAAIFTVSRRAAETLLAAAADFRDRQVFPFGPGDVKQVQIARNDRRLTLVKLPDAGWMLKDPVQSKADDLTAEAAVAALLQWRVSEFIDTAPTNLVACGLTPPAWAVGLWTRVPTPPAADTGTPPQVAATGDALSHPVWVGLNVSATGPATNRLYGCLDGSREVFTLDAALAASPFADPRNSLRFRDRTVMAIPTGQIYRITMLRQEIEQSVARDETGAWTHSGATERTVVPAAVEAILFSVANLRALRVAALDPADRLAQYGLDRPEFALTLRLSGDAGIQKTLLVGKSAGADGSYAMVKGMDTVFVLGRESVRRLSAPLTAPKGPP